MKPAYSGPLYPGIAAQLTYAIATGRLKTGTELPALRRAEAVWGVNLQTVRRAYRELARLGLVRIQDRRRTVVLAGSTPPAACLQEVVASLLQETYRRFGATPGDVTSEIRRMVKQRTEVCVVECSRTLAGGIADQLVRNWRVKAVPRLLAEKWPPGRPLVSTYFHLKDLRTRLGHRTTPTVCVRIKPSARVLEGLRARVRDGSARAVALCETDAAFARNLAAELRAALGPDVPLTVSTPADLPRFLDTADRRAVKLLSPRNWDVVPEERKGDPALVLLEYEVDPADLAALGRRWGWRPLRGRQMANR